MTSSAPRLFCFGLGYSAQVLARALIAKGWSVAGTCRDKTELDDLAAEAFLFDQAEDISPWLAGATHVLSSVPPGQDGDPVLNRYGDQLAAIPWAGYLSTTGVYGDRDGGWVREGDALNPTSDRATRRAAAEAQWRALMPVHIFRLAGIYGPGRNVLDGKARPIEKPGHMFSRIHVHDIANVVQASMARPHPGAIYNVCDDEAAAPAEVIAYGYRLRGLAPPPTEDFAQVEKDMSPMKRSFWADNKRVDNSKIKSELGVKLIYPTYREGLAACM